MNNKVLSFYDWFLIAGVIASNIIYSALSGNVDIVGSVAGIAGVLCVVLVAKGSIWNYLFGIINVSMYAYISYKAALYGDAALNALYYVPMQFIGWWQWRRRGAAVSEAEAGGAGVQVKARRFSWRQRDSRFGMCNRRDSRRICLEAFRRSAAVQGFCNYRPEYRGSGAYGACIHGAVGVVDHHQCHKCDDVVHLRGPRRGSCGRHGHHVGVLSA